MNNFFYRNRHKFILVVLSLFIVIGLSSCRMDASKWYTKAYTTFGQEWIDLWNNGKGFWNTLWGWPVNLLSYPIAWLCSTIGKGMGNSYFWGILFTTLIVRTIAWPIYSKQNQSSLKMTLMQPEMTKIQKKYEHRKDPQSQQQMQQEMAKLYKKYGVNPLGCGVTMFLQFPIFMSMYEVVQRVNATTTEVVSGSVVSVTYAGKFALANTKMFGIFEMTTSFFNATQWYDKVFSAVIALLFVGVTLLSQKLSSRPAKYQKIHPNDKNAKNDQAKQMKYMMVIMNVMFGFMALSNTSLGIYWLIGGIYQLFQSQVGRWMNEREWEKQQKQEIL